MLEFGAAWLSPTFASTIRDAQLMVTEMLLDTLDNTRQIRTKEQRRKERGQKRRGREIQHTRGAHLEWQAHCRLRAPPEILLQVPLGDQEDAANKINVAQEKTDASTQRPATRNHLQRTQCEAKTSGSSHRRTMPRKQNHRARWRRIRSAQATARKTRCGNMRGAIQTLAASKEARLQTVRTGGMAEHVDIKCCETYPSQCILMITTLLILLTKITVKW